MTAREMQLPGHRRLRSVEGMSTDGSRVTVLFRDFYGLGPVEIKVTARKISPGDPRLAGDQPMVLLATGCHARAAADILAECAEEVRSSERWVALTDQH